MLGPNSLHLSEGFSLGIEPNADDTFGQTRVAGQPIHLHHRRRLRDRVEKRLENLPLFVWIGQHGVREIRRGRGG